jgi:competence protein ComFC
VNLANLWQIIFPEVCLACRRRGDLLCAACLGAAPPPAEEIPEIISLFDYRHETLKKAIWHLKYRNKKQLARALGIGAAERLLPELSDLALFKNFDDPILVPVPAAAGRLARRSYNQAELLAFTISLRTGFPLVRALKKIKETPSQVTLRDRAMRLRNLHGAFAVVDKKVKGRNVFVVDDVATTGATIAEARRALLAAGAARVLGLTIAH